MESTSTKHSWEKLLSLKKSIGLQETAVNTILHFQHSVDSDI